MDMKLFKEHLARKQKQLAESDVRYATKYPGFTISLPPDDSGEVELAGGKRIKLHKGEIVNITTTDGRTHKNVKLTGVVDEKHAGLGGKLYFASGNATMGLSTNGIKTLELVRD